MDWTEAVTERDEVLDQIARVKFGLKHWSIGLSMVAGIE